MENNLIFLAYHAPTIENNKLVVPASLISIEQCSENDCFNSPIIAKLNQRYARPNKKFNGSTVTIDMFKGKQGIQEIFYTENEIIDYLKMLTTDGYVTKRVTAHNENDLADNIFKAMYSFNMDIARNTNGMKLPS